jgi:branched-chain amino acid transport system ATP-binding protein
MISVDRISVYYGEVKALSDVSLHVGEGEMVALIGANGAGKSTLLDTISGLVAPKTGSITWRGENIAGREPNHIVRQGIIHVPEGREIFPLLTVIENLMMGAYLAADKDEIKKNLERVYTLFPVLKERAGRSAQTLSGGEQQMLAVGRAIMAGPKLLMLDEPSLGIAPKLVQEIFRVIRSLNEQGLSILLVEQNVFLSLKFSHRGYVLERGQLVLEGSSQDLLKNPEIEKAYLGI